MQRAVPVMTLSAARDAHGAGLVRQAGEKDDLAGEVHALLALGEGAAQDDIVHERGIEAPGALEKSAHDGGGHVVGPYGGQATLEGLADGGSSCGDEDGFVHD